MRSKSVYITFVVGGLAFSAYQVDAFGLKGFGMHGGMFKGEKPDMPEMSEEMKAQMEEHKAEMQAMKEEWQDMTPEERQAKIEELKESWPKPQRCGFWGMHGFCREDVNYEVTNIDNGVQITITSDDADIVAKIQEMAAKMSECSDDE